MEEHERGAWILVAISIAKSTARSDAGEPSTGIKIFDRDTCSPLGSILCSPAKGVATHLT